MPSWSRPAASSSQARPGSFISARSRSSDPGVMASTRQKSSAFAGEQVPRITPVCGLV
jgi:hypothetical protein